MLAAGSRGDVQPCLALGGGLASQGHAVRVIASPRYQDLITGAGLEFRGLSHDPTQIVASPEGQELLAAGRNPVGFIRGFQRVLGPLLARMLSEVQTGAEGADLVLAPSFGFLGLHLSQHLHVPHAVMHFQPSQPTGAFPHPLTPGARFLGRLGNRCSFEAVDLASWMVSRRTVNAWRRQSLGLAPMRLPAPFREVRRAPVLCAFSPAVVPRPADWGANVHLTGFWFHEQPRWTPPQRLVDFLDAGPPPVYVGFGSMRAADPEATDRAVRVALRRAGLRGVLAGDPGASDDDTFVAEEIPHHWLFPRVSAVVHHGGAGTTAAALRAGVPQLVCPFFGDQPYWAERVHRLGAGPKPLPARHITVEAMSNRVRDVTAEGGHTEAARRLSLALNAEDGVAHACRALNRLLPR
ncbi:glycosyltransferase [Streptacidiphilus anmyonensis]|uniref:glycosyltransferase n=1 Tax=Streptacidiphilus anmyonensis TaxID=405782 RepID=UPI001F428F7E|nr:glycosyltransferase [Streptacidiphilus anmyonensis]